MPCTEQAEYGIVKVTNSKVAVNNNLKNHGKIKFCVHEADEDQRRFSSCRRQGSDAEIRSCQKTLGLHQEERPSGQKEQEEY